MTRNGDEQTTLAAANLRDALLEEEIEEVHPHSGLVHDRDALELLSYLAGQDLEDSHLYQQVLSTEASRATSEAVEAGNVSQMQFMIGYVDNAQDGEDGLVRAARRLSDEGAIGLVVGPPGSGKTATAIDTAAIWQALTGGEVVSNVQSWDLADETVTSSSGLKDALASSEGQVLAVLDELGQTLTSRGEEQQDADEFAKDLKYIRKDMGDGFASRGSLLGVGHTFKDIAKDIRRLATLYIQKPSRRDPGRMVLFDSQGGQDSRDGVGKFKGITDTAQSYREWEASEFVVDRDDVEDVEDDDDQDDARRAQVRTAIKAVKPWDDEGMSQEAVARWGIVTYSSSWVGDRCREWREGEWRELVADPRDD